MFVKNKRAGITVEILPMEISIVVAKMLEMFMFMGWTMHCDWTKATFQQGPSLEKSEDGF